jgi:hypothetical protein
MDVSMTLWRNSLKYRCIKGTVKFAAGILPHLDLDLDLGVRGSQTSSVKA